MDRGMLNKATEAGSNPTPGYMYREISAMTYSTPVGCSELEEYLLKKLQRNDPYVKLKVLRIIRHVCQNGKPEFRRSMQRKSEVIKAHLSYRGPPHMLIGDAPSKEVRGEADICIKVLFGPENNSEFAAPPDLSNKIEGFGNNERKVKSTLGVIAPQFVDNSNSYMGSTGTGNNFIECGKFAYRQPTGLQGFGNPNFDHALGHKQGNSIVQNIADAAAVASQYIPDALVKSLGNIGLNIPSSLASIRDRSTSYVASKTSGQNPFTGEPIGHNGMYLGFGEWRELDSSRGVSSNVYTASGSSYQFNRPMDNAGTWGQRQATPAYSQYGIPPSMSQYGIPPSTSQCDIPPSTSQYDIPPSMNTDSGNFRNTYQTSTDPGEYEMRIIDEICMPGGARIAPPDRTLREFCTKCQTLDSELVCTFLLERLVDGQTDNAVSSSWQSKRRVLYIFEALVSHVYSPAVVIDSVNKYLRKEGGDVLMLLADTTPQCRPKAIKLLQDVGLINPSPMNTTKEVVIDNTSSKYHRSLLDSRTASSDDENNDRTNGKCKITDLNTSQSTSVILSTPVLRLPTGNSDTAEERKRRLRDNDTCLISLLDDGEVVDMLSEKANGRKPTDVYQSSSLIDVTYDTKCMNVKLHSNLNTTSGAMTFGNRATDNHSSSPGTYGFMDSGMGLFSSSGGDMHASDVSCTTSNHRDVDILSNIWEYEQQSVNALQAVLIDAENRAGRADQVTSTDISVESGSNLMNIIDNDLIYKPIKSDILQNHFGILDDTSGRSCDLPQSTTDNSESLNSLLVNNFSNIGKSFNGVQKDDLIDDRLDDVDQKSSGNFGNIFASMNVKNGSLSGCKEAPVMTSWMRESRCL